jgi:nitrate reductase gamma subunit
MTNQFRIQASQEDANSTVADLFNVAAIALTSVLGLLTIAATI